MKNKRVNIVPKLRFSEFRDEWKTMNGDVAFDQISNKQTHTKMTKITVRKLQIQNNVPSFQSLLLKKTPKSAEKRQFIFNFSRAQQIKVKTI